MRAILACFLVALLLPLSGCLEPSRPALPRAVSADDCRAGEGAVFLAGASGGGYMEEGHVPHLYEVTRDERLRVMGGYLRDGEGKVVEASPGSMGNLSAAAAREMLERRNISLEDRDFEVTRGMDAQLTPKEFGDFCMLVAAAFPHLETSYVEGSDRCMDAGATVWTLSLRQGQKTVYVHDCALDGEEMRPLVEELSRLEDAHAATRADPG